MERASALEPGVLDFPLGSNTSFPDIRSWVRCIIFLSLSFIICSMEMILQGDCYIYNCIKYVLCDV